MNLSLKDITKSFPQKSVLNGITVDFTQGSIHALVGENGAGKTTLARILCGNLLPDSGTIILGGREVSIKNEKDALRFGISAVRQNPLLFEDLSVKENIFLAGEKKFFFNGVINQRALSTLHKLCPDLNLSTKIRHLGGNKRFYISLAIALLNNPKILLLDEPCAFLDQKERKTLYEFLTDLKKQNLNIIVITHSKAEAENYCDSINCINQGTITVLENYYSFRQKTNPSAQIQNTESQKADSSPAMEIKNLSCKERNKPLLLSANISIDHYDITAVTGLKEAAMETLEEAICGYSSTTAKGKIIFHNSSGKAELLKGKKINTRNLRKCGVAIIPSDKYNRGSGKNITVKEMMEIYGAGPKEIISMIENAQVKTTPADMVSSLSGGMLQRLILERELSIDPEIIILCNPFQGLDTAAQGNLANRLLDVKKTGKAILILGSADFPLSLCGKVYSLEGGMTKSAYEKVQFN